MALSGVRVVDLTRILAGPFCTMLLADMGADVIKIESPGAGDPVRRQGAIKHGVSWYFAQFNRNKRSATLDLRQAEGKAVLAELVAKADVLVENYRPGVLAEMGFDAARLEALNPRLIVTSVNGFGSTGPYADRPAFDFIAQAMSGFMSVNGKPDDEPLRAAPPLSDLIAGLYAAYGTVCALLARGRLGPEAGGQRVEASLNNGLISMMAYLSAETLATGQVPRRTGNDHPIVAPYGLFQAADGEIAVAASHDGIVKRFLDVLGLGALLQRPEFADNAQRMRNRPSINAAINAQVAQDTVANWIRRLNAAGVPCGRVQDLNDVFADPQVLAQEMVLEIEHPGHGPVKVTGFPVKLDRTPARVRHPSPELGQHTEEVMREVGIAPERIARLRTAGVI
jgi:crotonobetainyl-CoA:carnitine CoA-transferase CaiB-like acyl-CoA transferase